MSRGTIQLFKENVDLSQSSKFRRIVMILHKTQVCMYMHAYLCSRSIRGKSKFFGDANRNVDSGYRCRKLFFVSKTPRGIVCVNMHFTKACFSLF